LTKPIYKKKNSFLSDIKLVALRLGIGLGVMGDYLLEVVVQQILQTTTTKVVDKQPAVVHWLSTTSLIRVIDW
jgi:hypothetical protein